MKAPRHFTRPTLTQLENREVPAGLLGSLDQSFAVGGKANFTIAAGTNQANAVLVQPDGRILLAGTTDATNGPNADFFVTRHNVDGSFDTTFGSGGKVIFGQANKEDVVTGLGLLGDGSIIGAGYTNRGGQYDMAVFKLNPNGGIDPGFAAGSGLKLININGNDKAYAVEISNNRIVVVGASDIDGPNPIDKDDIAVARLQLDGTFDPTFNTGSPLVVSLGQQEQARDLAVDLDGSIVLAGYRQDPTVATSADFVVLRIQGDGTSVVPTFGTDTLNGVKASKIDFAGNNDQAFSVDIQADGAIVAAGSAFIPADTDFAVVRLKGADGTLDSTFGNTGKVTLDLGGNDVANDVMIDARGRIILTGSAFKTDSFDMTAASLEPDGKTLTPSFGTNGTTYVNVITEDKAFASTIDNRGRIVLTGRALGNVAVARLNGRSGESVNLLVGGSGDGRAVEYVPGTATPYTTPGTGLVMLSAFDKLVRTAIGDVNGDGVEDRVAVAGTGALPLLTVRSGVDNSVITAPFNVFESSFTGGMYVTVEDLNNDGFADVIVTPDQSGGPVVAIYDGSKLSTGLSGDAAQIVRFFGIDDPNFRGGARVAAGDVDGDGFADMVVSAGFSGGPRVALFNGKQIITRVGEISGSGGRPDQSFRLRPDFFVFENTLRNGAFVAVGDLNGDGFSDLIFGGGPGGGPRVRAVDGKATLALTSLTSLDDIPPAGVQLNNYFAGSPDTRGGVRLTTRDIDGDDLADIVAGSGDNLPSSVLIYRGANLLNNPTPTADQTIDPYASAIMPNGVFVG